MKKNKNNTQNNFQNSPQQIVQLSKDAYELVFGGKLVVGDDLVEGYEGAHALLVLVVVKRGGRLFVLVARLHREREREIVGL